MYYGETSSFEALNGILKQTCTSTSLLFACLPFVYIWYSSIMYYESKKGAGMPSNIGTSVCAVQVVVSYTIQLWIAAI